MKTAYGFVAGVSAALALAGAAVGGEVVLEADLEIDDGGYHNLTDDYSGPGGIRVIADPLTNRIVSFSGYLTNSLEGAGVMVIPNARFRDVVPLRATAGGAAMTGGEFGAICNRRDHDGYSTVEFQIREGATAIKLVGMKLTQRSGDVLVTYATPETGHEKLLCYYLNCKSTEIADSLLGTFSYSGSSLYPADTSAYRSSGWAETVAVSKGSGSYGIVDPVFSVPTYGSTGSISGYVTASPTVVLENAYYLDVDPMAGSARGGTISQTAWGRPMAFCHRREFARSSSVAGAYSEVQAQMWEGQYVKCVFIRIEQSGDDVAVSAVGARYKDFGTADEAKRQVGVHDFVLDPGGQGTVATSDAVGYGLTNAVFGCRGGTLVRLSGNNTYLGGTSVNGGTLVADGGNTSLPPGGQVLVANGATLVLDESVEGNDKGQNADIRVIAGSRLLRCGMWNSTDSTYYTADSSTIDNRQSADYVRTLSLLNGSELGGSDKVRIGDIAKTHGGATTNNFVYSGGTGTNVISAALMPYRISWAPSSFLSFDTDADLLVTGPIVVSADAPATYAAREIYKRGAKTLRLRGASSNRAEWRLLDGIVRLEADNVLWASNSVLLAGGDLVCGAGTTNGIASLSVNGGLTSFGLWPVSRLGGRIVFENGSKLAVAGKGTIDHLTGGEVVELSGGLSDGSFRIGTNRCLTSAELKVFVYTDAKGGVLGVRQDDAGYILPKTPSGLILIFR